MAEFTDARMLKERAEINLDASAFQDAGEIKEKAEVVPVPPTVSTTEQIPAPIADPKPGQISDPDPIPKKKKKKYVKPAPIVDPEPIPEPISEPEPAPDPIVETRSAIPGAGGILLDARQLKDLAEAKTTVPATTEVWRDIRDAEARIQEIEASKAEVKKVDPRIWEGLSPEGEKVTYEITQESADAYNVQVDVYFESADKAIHELNVYVSESKTALKDWSTTQQASYEEYLTKKAETTALNRQIRAERLASGDALAGKDPGTLTLQQQYSAKIPQPGSLAQKFGQYTAPVIQAGRGLVAGQEQFFEKAVSPLTIKAEELRQYALEHAADAPLLGTGAYLGSVALSGAGAFVHGASAIIRPGLMVKSIQSAGALVFSPEARGELVSQVARDPFRFAVEVAGGVAGGYASGKVIEKLLPPTKQVEVTTTKVPRSEPAQYKQVQIKGSERQFLKRTEQVTHDGSGFLDSKVIEGGRWGNVNSWTEPAGAGGQLMEPAGTYTREVYHLTTRPTVTYRPRRIMPKPIKLGARTTTHYGRIVTETPVTGIAPVTGLFGGLGAVQEPGSPGAPGVPGSPRVDLLRERLSELGLGSSPNRFDMTPPGNVPISELSPITAPNITETIQDSDIDQDFKQDTFQELVSEPVPPQDPIKDIGGGGFGFGEGGGSRKKRPDLDLDFGAKKESAPMFGGDLYGFEKRSYKLRTPEELLTGKRKRK